MKSHYAIIDYACPGDQRRTKILRRHLARLSQVDSALELFGQVAAGGFYCYPASVSDPLLVEQALACNGGFSLLVPRLTRRHGD